MNESAPARPGSLQVARIAGIPIRLHFTFLLLLAYVVYLANVKGSSQLAWLMPAIFACLLLHELGHALTAKKFGIKTREITLYMIGGIAFIEGRPKPKEEFWIAIAGPLVNVVIAAILFPIVQAAEGNPFPIRWDLEGSSFLQALFYANVLIPAFNMIPALPMDGGRILRALLAMTMKETAATNTAASIAQVLAFGMAIAGIWIPNILLILIALFVFIGAGQEAATSMGYSLVRGRRIGDAMITNFVTIGSGETLAKAGQMLLAGSQQDFPVVWGEDTLGLLTREDIIRGLSSAGPDQYVAGYMRRSFPALQVDAPLEDALALFGKDEHLPILVMNDTRLVGMVTPENFGEFLALERARQR